MRLRSGGAQLRDLWQLPVLRVRAAAAAAVLPRERPIAPAAAAGGCHGRRRPGPQGRAAVGPLHAGERAAAAIRDADAIAGAVPVATIAVRAAAAGPAAVAGGGAVSAPGRDAAQAAR